LLTVGLCAIVRNEASYIQEWAAFHHLQGVFPLLIFDNGSTDGTGNLLRAARSEAGISVIECPRMASRFDSVQRQAYAQGAQLLAGKADWVLFVDADEFVYSEHGRLASAFSVFPENTGAVAIGQRVFGSSGRRLRGPAPVSSRFTRCTPLSHSEAHWFKTAARPELIERFDSVHSVELRAGHYLMADGSPLMRSSGHPGCADQAVDGRIRLNHYMLKSREEFRAKQRRWADTDIASRYDEAYFTSRDSVATERDARLAAWRDRLDQAVDRIWPDGNTGYQFGPRHRLRRTWQAAFRRRPASL
jgi:glycosyltransferase involved in cell wall biosynthesis